MNFFLSDLKKIFTIIIVLVSIFLIIFFFTFLAILIIPIILILFFIRNIFIKKNIYKFNNKTDSFYKKNTAEQSFIEADYDKKEEKDI